MEETSDNLINYHEISRSMKPEVDPSCFISDKATIVGDVIIEKNCSVWPYAVIRGDKNRIHIKEGSNVQDNCVIHVTDDDECIIGKNTSLGHCCMVHGAKIGDQVIVGISAVILDGAEIGDNSVIGAGAVVLAGMKVPENSLVIGIPAKIVKTSPDLAKMTKENAENYHKLAERHRKGVYQTYDSRKKCGSTLPLEIAINK